MRKVILFVLFFIHAMAIAQDSLINSENLPELILTKGASSSENLKPAEFPSGINAFREMLMQNIRTDKISGTSDIHCELQFVIDKEGNITDIKATGNNEEFNQEVTRALSQIKEKWKPGTINGIPVRSRMRAPLDLKFNEDDSAKFPTGEDAFKKMILENLQTEDSQEKKSCIISFTVAQDGRLSKIKARGTDKRFNKNVERAVSKIKERWIPRFHGGISVASEVEITFEKN